MIAAGAALGLLVGLLLGLSTAPVVATVVSALAAVLAAALTFGKVPPDGAGRIAGAGLGAVAGVLIGLFLRGQDAAVPSVKAEVARWTDAGFTPDRARDLVAYARLGVKPAGLDTAVRPDPNGSSHLFAGPVADLCADIQTLNDAAAAATILARPASGMALPAAAALLRRHPDSVREVRALLCGN